MAKRKLTTPNHSRDINFIKPTRFRDHKTITELSRIVGKDVSWLRRLERDEKIPKAARVRWGQLSVRLWSPEQVNEIVDILKTMKPGRPRKED